MFTLDYGSGSRRSRPPRPHIQRARRQQCQHRHRPDLEHLQQRLGQLRFPELRLLGEPACRQSHPRRSRSPESPAHWARPAPFAFGFYEVGNENYGSWETDHHTPGPRSHALRRVRQAVQRAGGAGSIRRSRSGSSRRPARRTTTGPGPSWIAAWPRDSRPASSSITTMSMARGRKMTTRCCTRFRTRATTSAGHPAQYAYRTLMYQRLGPAVAANVDLMATEFNSIYSDPWKQSDQPGQRAVRGRFRRISILQTECSIAWIWDLRNGFDTTSNAYNSNVYGCATAAITACSAPAQTTGAANRRLCALSN